MSDKRSPHEPVGKPLTPRGEAAKHKAARQPCTATVVDPNSGVQRPCRSWAMRGTEPPLCYAHGVLAGTGKDPSPGRRRHLHYAGATPPAEPRQQPSPPTDLEATTGLALYRDLYDEEETAALMAMGDPASLEGEMATVRVIIRRLLEYLTRDKEASADVLLRFAGMIFKGTGAVAHLVREEKGQALDSKEAQFAAARDKALEELAEEWGFKDASSE